MGNILVVDDNEDMCQVISDVLRAEGHMVGIAYDGKSALNALGNKLFDVMILDYKLFDMNGLEVLEQRMGMVSPYTIMVSAYGSESVKARARELEVRDFLDKPFDVNAILKVVRKALWKKGQDMRIQGEVDRSPLRKAE
jgi:DNA-binding response OmpR family regulator